MRIMGFLLFPIQESWIFLFLLDYRERMERTAFSFKIGPDKRRSRLN